MWSSNLKMIWVNAVFIITQMPDDFFTTVFPYDLPSQDNIEEVIVDAGAAKGQSQPILVHAKGDSKSKSNKPSAA